MKKTIFTLLLAVLFANISAQNVTTASSSMQAGSWAVTVPYDVTDEGEEFQFMFGKGGWSWDFFAYQQRNHCGVENLSIARVGCTLAYAESYATLPSTVASVIDKELTDTSPTGVKKVFFLPGIGNVGDQQGDASGTPTWNTTQRNNYVNNIVLAAEYIVSKGYEIFGVAPFNEPDFETTYTGNASNFNAVAAIMQTKPVLAGKVVGPSTLNSSEASKWYSTIKNNINYANTHQLAGDKWSDYIGFWDTAYSDGKKPVADEMHNVMEAMVCINHGGVAGTWWGWEGITRGEYVRMIKGGSQLAYKERPNEWMTASVNKYPGANGRVEAFIGTSERQAVASAFTFLSKGRLAYYDGYGPAYDYTEEVPGGAKGSYQSGQTNAERLININTGEDVPVEPINGQYKIVNKATGKILSIEGGNPVRANVYQWTDGGLANQIWDVNPIDKTTVADYSYVIIRNANTSSIPLYLDAQAWAMDNGANVSVWSDGDALSTPPNAWQRWHLRYVGDGYYNIINHNTGRFLDVNNGNKADGTNVFQWEGNGADNQLWKFVPADNAVDAVAPAVPTGLAATGQSGAVKLTWSANTDADIYGYMVYRYNDAAGIWECIGRKVKGTSFLDNTCRKGQSLRYKIKALDESYNLSGSSEEITVSTASGNAVVGIWSGRSLKDSSPNKMDVVANGATFTTDNNHASFSFDGTDDYVKLPYHAGDMANMTFAAWVKVGSTTAGQRIFDFGNGEDEYLYLTPRSNGGKMRFEVKKSGTVQGLDATAALSTGTWTHVAVTIKKNDVKIYVNGVQNATTSSVTILPMNVQPTVCYIGRSQSESDPAFKGLMSDVRLYNYAMTANEISELAKITSNTGSYDVTAERIPNIADNVDNWDTHTGKWATWSSSTEDATNLTSPYVRTSGAGVGDLTKTLTYMPEGQYKLTANVYAYYNSYISTRNVQQLFFNSQTLTINSARNRTATLREISGSVADDNKLEFGLKITSASSATNTAMDNVSITYSGTNEEFADGIEEITYKNKNVENAEQLVVKAMNADVKAELKNALQNVYDKYNVYRTSILSGIATTTVVNEWIAAIEALPACVPAAEASVEAYSALGNAISAAYTTKADNSREFGHEAFAEEMAPIEAAYNAGEYDDSEIAATVNAVKGITNRYLMADAVEYATPDSPEDVTAFIVGNASFIGDSFDSWTTSPNPGMGYDAAEFFNTNFNIYQTLIGMPAGTYRLQTRAFYRYGDQPGNYTAHNNGTLQRNAKLYISHSEGSNVVDIMAISDDPSEDTYWGGWSAELYDGKPVPNNMQAGAHAIDGCGKYAPKDGYNSVDITVSAIGDLTIGAKKETFVTNDWTFFGDFSLFYCGNYVELDENGAGIPETSRADANITLRRTIKGTTWNTICLPFSMSEEQVKETFGENVQLRELTDAVTTNGDANLYFTTRTSIEANKPYLMKNATLGSSYIIKGVDYTPATPTSEVNGVLFNGVYAKTVLDNASGQDYYIVSNEIKSSPGTTNIKGFRAFFKVPAGSEVRAMRLFPEGDDEATAIEGVMTDEGDLMVFPADIYSVSGQLVRKKAVGLDGLPRGVYIVGGQKIVVK